MIKSVTITKEIDNGERTTLERALARAKELDVKIIGYVLMTRYDNSATVLCSRRTPFRTEFIVWWFNDLTNELYSGGYYEDLASATKDFNERSSL